MSLLHSVSLSFALSMSLSSRGKSAVALALSSSSRSSPAFRNPLVMVDRLTLLHAVRIHWQTCEKVALRMRPVFVKDLSPLVIQASHWTRSATLNERFTLMSRGCKYFVVPPGITAGIEFVVVDGCFHRICYMGPHAVQNKQCLFSVKKSPRSLPVAFFQPILH